MAATDRLVLTDYSPVPEEERAFCEELQEQIDSDRFDIIIPEHLSDDTDGSRPQVFGRYNGRCYTRKYAGTLHYKGRTVVIHSRFDGVGEENHFLNYVLHAAVRLPMKILRTREETASQGSFDLLLTQLFFTQLQDAYSVGVYREYRSFEHNDSRPRGHLDIARHIRLNPKENGRIAYTTREYTADNPVNHLLLAACGCLLTRPETAWLAERLLEAEPALRRPMDELRWQLGHEELSRTALNRTARLAMRPITHPLHQRYEAVRRTALLILREEGLDLFRDEDLQVGGVLIPMDKTWELCLEHTVFQDMEAVETQKKIPVILKGEKKGMRNFVPDFLTGFRMDGDRVTARAVLDAKYRKAWETVCATGKHWDEFVRADVFQVFGYMYVTGAELGGIIAPVRQQEAQKAALRDYPICEGMEQRFCVIPLVIPNGAGKDYQTFRTEMDASCARCAAAVRKLTAPKQE